MEKEGEETRELEDPVESGKRDVMFRKSKFSRKRKIIAVVVAVFVIAIIIAVVLAVVLKKSKKDEEKAERKTESSSSTPPLPKTESPIPPLPTGAPLGADGPYSRGVVAADAPSCSEVGRDILKKNGSAVDSAVATLFCIGVINMHSAGIGGGGFMVIYSKAKKEVKVYDYREMAPGKANQTMYVNSSLDSKLGPSASGIPGEIKGFHAAWRQYGRLQWKELVQPAIDFAKNGFRFGHAAFAAASRTSVLEAIKKDEGLSQLLLDGEGNLKKLGSVLTMPKFATTLETIRDNPDSFYTGELAEDIVKDVQEKGGIITLEDMKTYNVSVRDAVTAKMGDYTWYTNPPPGSGAVLSLILNILKGYNMTGADLKDLNSSVLTYHRIVEAFKFAYAYRALLGDEDFSGVDEIVRNMTDTAFGESLRQKIHDDRTFLNFTYYGDFYSSIGIGGTSSMSVISPDGDAVAATNTINLYFGSKYRSTRTGIIYNNEMDDFSTPGKKNAFGVEPSESNFIQPFKRPMSSMTPTIFLDNEWVPRLVVGASGGTKITTAISLVVMNYLWFNRTLSQSVIEPRLHHQLLPMYIRMDKDYPMPLAIQEGLQRLGHEVRNITGYAVVQAAATNPDGKLYGKADPRKHSWAAGF